MKNFLKIAAVATLLVTPAHAADLLKIASSQRGAWDTAIAEMGERAGIMAKHNLKLEIFYTSGGAESQLAVISGSADIAVAVGISATLSAYGKGAPLRIIGGEMAGPSDLYWYVPAASPIKTMEDVRGKSISYSIAGSSSHAALLELLAQYKVDAKTISAGSPPSTMTQTLSGQIDVGWAPAPFGLDALADGKIRILARGDEIKELKDRVARVNVTTVQALQTRGEMIARFSQAYKETVDWMYANQPEANKIYGEFSGLPESVVSRVRDFFPKQTLDTDRLPEMEKAVADAVRLKFLREPLNATQLDELVKIQNRKK